MTNPRQEIHTLAAFTHGVLVAFHTLGAIYNARKGNHWQTVGHVMGIAFSMYGTIHHIQEAQFEYD